MYLLAHRKTKTETTIQNQSMVSWIVCTYIILTLMLAIRTSTASTCTTYGQEERKGVNYVRNNLNKNCKIADWICSDVGVFGSLTCKNGTHCTYADSQGEIIGHAQLDDINNVETYKMIHQLSCQYEHEETACPYKMKLRFGRYNNGITFKKIYNDFQKEVTTQKCYCYPCTCVQDQNSCAKYNGDNCFEYFCNCKYFSTTKHETLTTVSSAVSTMMTHSSTEHITSTPAPLNSVKTDPSTTQLLTSTTEKNTGCTTCTVTNIVTTMEPVTTTTVPLSFAKAASQFDGNSVPTLAAVGGVLALVILLSIATIFVCLRRKKRSKKDSDCSEACVTNPSYGDLQDNERAAGKDNPGYEETGNDVHNYDMADDPKRETTYGQDYSYANFGGQPKFQDVMPSLKNDHKVDEISANYFVLETKDNDANERVETLQTEGNNYCLLEERPNSTSDGRSLAKRSAITETGNGRMTGIQGDNYFLVEQQNNSEENDQENGVYALAQSQSQTKSGYERNTNDEQKRPGKSDRDMDPYDHVRVGHVQTNGIGDGVYDELRKQNVRYESEEIDNDYDHC